MDEVESLFSKKFCFQSSRKWKLPSSHEMFSSPSFHLDAMQEMKKKLNSMKSKLNDFELTSWHQHTRHSNPAGLVTRHLRCELNAEMCTQAWAKFHEIVSTYKLIPDEAILLGSLNTVHLCEAPGAFIGSLNHYVKSHCVGLEWQWSATTLNPFYEGNSPGSAVTDDRFILETLEQWDFGKDNSGDIMNWSNVESLCTRVSQWSVQLVTADGSVDCQDVPDEQESHVAPLHYCETVTALTILDKGGSFLIKMFTMFEHQTICLMYLLGCAFEQVNVMKPATSKSGNSEVYVICLGYKGRDVVTSSHLDSLQQAFGVVEGTKACRPLFPLELIAADALEEMVECARIFMEFQITAIERNISLYNFMTSKQKAQLYSIKKQLVSLYVAKYHMKPLQQEQYVVKQHHLDGTCLSSRSVWTDTTRKLHSGTYSERQERNAQSWEDRVKQSRVIEDSTVYSTKRFCSRKDNYKDSFAEIIKASANWFKTCGDALTSSHIEPVSGGAILKVLSSPFCSRQILDDYTDAVCNAKVLCHENSAAVCQLFCNAYPFYAFQVREVPYFLSSDGLNMASICSVAQIEKSVGSFLDLSGRYGGYESYFRWMFPKAKIHVAHYGAMRCSEGHELTRDVQVHQVSGVNRLSVKGLCESVLSSGCIDVVVGDTECVTDTDYPPYRKEIQTRPFLLAHCIIALNVLKLGGSFICRLFDCFTRVTAAVLFVLHKVFDKICIMKPLTSCPLTADRFVVCKGFRSCDAAVVEKLSRILDQMIDCECIHNVVEIVPMSQLLQAPFCEFLITTNDSLSRQITHILIQVERQFLQPTKHTQNGDNSSEAVCSSILNALGLPCERESILHTM